MPETHVIIGAGQSGAWAAAAMRESGFPGRIILVGEEAVPPYERPPLSKSFQTRDEVPPLPAIHAADFYASRGIEVLFGRRAISIDPTQRTVFLNDGQRLSYDRLLLSTGGRARRPSIPGSAFVHCLRTVEDALFLRERLRTTRRLVCIGGGVIGLELASSARALGCEVTVLDMARNLMSRSLPAADSAFLEDVHRKAGVALHLGVTIRQITAEGDCLWVETSDGGRLQADLLVAGVGMERRVELATAADVTVRRGIVVDEFGQADVPGIYASGDVAEFYCPESRTHLLDESWQHAQNHGSHVGRCMAGHAGPYQAIPWFWTDQHGLNIQLAGQVHDTDEMILRGDPAKGSYVRLYLREGRLAAVVAVNNARDCRLAMNLIRLKARLDPSVLRDNALPLQNILRMHKATTALSPGHETKQEHS